MDKYGVCDGDLALVCRNRSKIDLCGPKSVHDHGDGISYLWDLGFYGFQLNRLEVMLEFFSECRSLSRTFGQTFGQRPSVRPSVHIFSPPVSFLSFFNVEI